MEVCIPSPTQDSLFSSQHILLSQLSILPPLSPVMFISLIPRSPEMVAQNIVTKMSLVHDNLMAGGEYLTDSTVVENVTWKPHSSGHWLIVHSPLPSLSMCMRTHHSSMVSTQQLLINSRTLPLLLKLSLISLQIMHWLVYLLQCSW